MFVKSLRPRLTDLDYFSSINQSPMLAEHGEPVKYAEYLPTHANYSYSQPNF